MGLGITVMVVDWRRLEAIPADERVDRLYEESYAADDVDAGWFWPGERAGTEGAAPWWGVYEFSRTLGSYKPHFWAGEAWDDARDHAEPRLRDALDGFLIGLGIRWDPEADDDDDVPPGEWQSGLLLHCPPAETSALAGLWSRAEPHLDGLRDAFDTHAARGPQSWIPDHAAFASLLRGWGEVVGEADRQGWGVIGLRC
ncbi:hypothetical protein ACFT5C_04535 [Streptomyces sp. NPDC057116]|uniref:hypothetical protein n=1 Tax=Streptomyces sp. NPDC057116 TaxID=3346023 RepID=UPI00362E7213